MPGASLGAGVGASIKTGGKFAVPPGWVANTTTTGYHPYGVSEAAWLDFIKKTHGHVFTHIVPVACAVRS